MSAGSIEPPAASPDSDYNPIFEILVSDPEDIQGLIAYGRYKVAKREWVEQCRRRTGSGPTEAQLREYVHIWTPALLDGLIEQSGSALANYASASIEAAKPGIREDAISGKIEADLREFKSSLDRAAKYEWFWTIVYAMIGAFLYTLLLIGIAFVLNKAGVDLLGIIERSRPGGV